MSARAIETQRDLHGACLDRASGRVKRLRPWLARLLDRGPAWAEAALDERRCIAPAARTESRAAYVEVRVGLAAHVGTDGAFTPIQLRSLAERARAAMHEHMFDDPVDREQCAFFADLYERELWRLGFAGGPDRESSA